ncbi:cytidylyltransferase domain-containing protein [Methanobrevibacter sp. DSM 116169]|uniref:cytidylyltransferase domain-containing protein n=1 Tax=Methanobrevibacter sp. DSM 116169 TaxID=3242727 RepID=UPI0038FC1569
MFENSKILIVIPARGGSKGIPSKNTRILGDKPLISYSIGIANASKYVDDVVVSTDDDEIKFIAEKFGAHVIKRSAELAEDDVPLDPVIYDALLQKEKMVFDEYDIVITVQPTSPLLKTSTLDQAIEKFASFEVDSVISVVDDRHLSWGYDEDSHRYYPLYRQRLNRQFLPKHYRETGSILATRRSFMSENSRLGNNIELIELSPEESVDIDNFEDWWVAEKYLTKKRVVFKVDAFNKIGTGHIYRCISIASKLMSHDFLFVLNKKHNLGIELIEKYNFPYVLHGNDKDLHKKIDNYNPHMVINDILNTSLDYVETLKSKGYFVVNFEDLGEGAKAADLVFDALYEHDEKDKNIYRGSMFYLLKEEFFFQKPKVVTEDVKNVLLTFGGTDPNNLTEKTLDALIATGFSKQINVILGIGYPDKKGIQEKYKPYMNVTIYENVKNISDYMVSADIIFTSAGRTMYEVCSLGVPCICLCQNERELTHTFGNPANGFINMGLGSDVSQDDIINQFNALAENFELRQDMNRRMQSIDLKYGFDNMWSIVKPTFRNFRLRNRFK